MFVAGDFNVWMLANGQATAIGGASSGAVAGYVDGVGTSAGINTARGLALDPLTQDLFVADVFNHNIRKYTRSTGAWSTVAGKYSQGGTGAFAESQGTAARFNQPRGLLWHPTLGLLVVDTLNNRIRLVSSTFAVSTLCGTGGSGYVNGACSVAQLFNPAFMALDSNNNVVFSTYGSGDHRIRRLNVGAMTVSTVAGKGTAALVDGSGAFCPQAWRASHTILPLILTIVCSEHCSKHTLTLCFQFLQSPAPRSTIPAESRYILSLATSMLRTRAITCFVALRAGW